MMTPSPSSETAAGEPHESVSVGVGIGASSPLALCCCGTYSQRPMLWLAFTVFFLFAGWWAFGFAGMYSRYWRPSVDVTPLHWYHAVPGFLFTLTLVFTIGARLYRIEGEDDDNDADSRFQNLYYTEGVCGHLHNRTLQTLRLIVVVGLVLSGWATAFMWAAKDWFEPELDPFMGYMLLLQALLSTMALLCRWRQIVIEFQLVRARRLGLYDARAEDGQDSMM